MAEGLLNFVVVGAKNSGKTVFLSTLFGMEQSVATANKETTDYLKVNWKELKNGALPSATSSRVITLAFEYKTDTHSVRFCIDDYDGYFIETLSAEEEQTQEDRDKLKNNIKEAEGLLFFFPYETTFDEESLDRFRYEINTFIQLIKEIYPDQKDLPIPAIIAVSKWDRSPDFGAKDQHQKATEYLTSVESYQAAMDMIKLFFADVKVEPVSSFGNSSDGVHPLKGQIEPYNIKGPFDYFLDVTFDKFEKRAADLRAADDFPHLYEFLTDIYNDVRYYKEGKLINLHSDVEVEYTSDVIEKLNMSSGPHAQKQILNEHLFLIHNLKNKELANEINAVVTANRTKRQKRIAIVAGVAILASLIIGYGALAYKEYEMEQNAFITIQQLKPQSNPKEFAERCTDYLERYSGKTFFLPITNIAERREYVGKALSAEKTTFVENLTKAYNRIKGQKPNERSLMELRDLETNANLFPDLDISQKATDFVNHSLTTLENQKQIRKMLNEAKIILSSDSDLSEVESIFEQLKDLPEDGEISEIRANLSQRIQFLKLKREFTHLYNEVKTEKTVREIPKIVSKQWRKDFPEEFGHRLTVLIQDKIAQIDTEAINDLRFRFESAMDVDIQERNLAEIRKHFVEIPQLSFHYQRDQGLINTFQKATSSTKLYRQLLTDGVWIEAIVFGATQKDNTPLKFACGYFKGNEIILKIEYRTFSYKDTPKPICTGVDDGRQQIRWETRFRLEPRAYGINVTESETFDDDVIDAIVSISKNDILYIYNHGEKKFPFSNYIDYFILFRSR